MRKLIMADFSGTWDSYEFVRLIAEAIVTGASFEDFWDVMDRYEGKRVPLFFNPLPKERVNLVTRVSHKAHVINQSEATDFYEDEKEHATMLKLLCPKCMIHLVEKGMDYR